MYKLVGVGGKVRGIEFLLEDGENSFGRQASNDHLIEVDGVSKNHFKITVREGAAYLEDLGSSNGTMVNGELTQKKTIHNQDKIVLPNAIFQVVFVREKIVQIVRKADQGENVDLDFIDSLETRKPKNLLERALYLFQKYIMQKLIYGFNTQYEWKGIIGFFILLFVVCNIIVIMQPLLRTNKAYLTIEVAKRANQYAQEVARTNRIPLRENNLDRINTEFLENSDNGIDSYELFDQNGRIVRPISKLNKYTSDSFSTLVLNAKRPNITKLLDDGIIGVGLPIRAHDLKTGGTEIVGYIAIKFAPGTLSAMAGKELESYAEAFIYSALMALILFGIIYYLTRNIIRELFSSMSDVTRGKKRDLETSFLMEELFPLKKIINNNLQSLRELKSEDGEGFQDIEEDSSYVQSLNEIMQGSTGAVLILNSEKIIQYINSPCEDLIGLRENSASGMSLLDTIRDQGFAATMIDLCDQSGNANGSHHQSNYEIGGRDYIIHVTSLIGKDNFPKAFYISFAEDI